METATHSVTSVVYSIETRPQYGLYVSMKLHEMKDFISVVTNIFSLKEAIQFSREYNLFIKTKYKLLSYLIIFYPHKKILTAQSFISRKC